MGFAVPALAIGGAALSAVGQIGQGEASAAEAKYQSQVAANNALIAQRNAGYALQAGQVQTTNQGLRERAQAGQLTTELAANNLDVNTGSAKAARISQAETGQQNVNQVAQNAQLAAYGYRTQASSYTAESELEKAEAPLDVTGGYLTGLGTLSAGAANVGYRWANLANPTGQYSPKFFPGGP